MDILESFYGGLTQWSWLPWVLGIGGWVCLGFLGARLWMFSLFLLGLLCGVGAPLWLLATATILLIPLNLGFIRRPLISAPLMRFARASGLVPPISATEKAALDAGTVWVEGDFFSGNPNFSKLMQENYPKLTQEEQAYLDGPIQKLCDLVDEWKIYQNREIPQDVWNYMKEIRIFGMIIPKKYGGLEFSAAAHSAVIMKLSSRSLPVTITAMVPNSLGPAELLNHYGSQEQKDYYLPRLAKGEEIPCFALTEQRAGSDAGSIESEGEVFEKNGKLFIRLNWNKRWITLASISSVLGLAFQLRDPKQLLGGDTELGITCALIPSKTKGVVLGRRHDPLGTPFYNCPTQGENVEIPIDWVIGGRDNCGKGWTMLMECLGAGRGISLPAQCTGGSKLVARVASAHSSIRKQFGLPLAKLEGLQEPLARIASTTYMMDALRRYTVGALDKGLKPSVVTAIAKYCATEMGRKVINDGMDIMAGTGITRGPRNLIANGYQATPISITVEGANILTRTLIIFGQGLFRAHPWAYKEIQAIKDRNLAAFDQAMFGHIRHVHRAFFRSILLSLSRGYLVRSPYSGPMKRYFQKLSWASASFSLVTDLAMGTMGGSLKTKEMLTGRFADILSNLYVSTAVLRRFIADGQPKEDLPLLHFSLQYSLSEIDKAFDGLFANFKVPVLGSFLRGFVRTWARFNAIQTVPNDRLTSQTAHTILVPGETRNRVSEGIYYPKDTEEALGRLERAFGLVKSAEAIERKISTAIKKRELPKMRIYRLIVPAFEKGIINADERQVLEDVAEARWDACHVDDFSEEEYHGVSKGDNKQFRDEYKGPAGPPKHVRSVA